MNTSYLKRELIDITKCLHLSEDFINSFSLNNHSQVKIAYLIFTVCSTVKSYINRQIIRLGCVCFKNIPFVMKDARY